MTIQKTCILVYSALLTAHKRETQTKLSAAPARRPDTRVQTSTTPATDLGTADM